MLLGGGYVHYEGQFFLVNYLDGRGLFEKIFSAHFNEWDCYQGRELSFVFGWLDAEFIRYSARLGWVHFYSLTHFVGLFALAVTLWRALPLLFPELERSHAGLVIALLLTNPAALLSGYYYRPAKILAAVFLAIVLLCVGKLREKDWKLSPQLVVSMGIAATLMGMSDRLGIYMLILIVIALAVARPVDRASVSIVFVLAAALAFNVFWSVVIGPRLSAAADGYGPDTVDQIVHLRFTFLDPAHYRPALSLLADHVEYFFGNFGFVSLAGVIGVASVVLWRDRSKRVLLTFAAVGAATVAVYVAMYARLESLAWPASRRVYYWLPQITVFAVGAAFVVGQSRAIFRRGGRMVTLVLLALIAGNLVAIPSHRAAIRSQEHRPWIVQSPALRECVRNPDRQVSNYALDAPYSQLCGSLRAAVAGVVWNGLPSADPNPKLYCRFSGRS